MTLMNLGADGESLAVPSADGGSEAVRYLGSLGLVGVLLAPIASDDRVANYAGRWSDYPTEPFRFRLRKRILRSR
jgi:hypothetical protein